jgi:hypothetical protein
MADTKFQGINQAGTKGRDGGGKLQQPSHCDRLVSWPSASHQAAEALNCETVCTSSFDYSTVKNAREMETFQHSDHF